MQPKSARYLRDILDCCEFIAENLQDRTLDDYVENRLLRQAIERNFEIIGEAAGRLSKTDPETKGFGTSRTSSPSGMCSSTDTIW